MTALSDLIVASNKSGASARALSRRAQDMGHSLNHDTAARYLRGDHGVPDEATLVAFSDVLNIPLRRLRSAANLPSETTAPYVPPPEASRLSRRQRRALDEIIRAMLESPRGGQRDELADRRKATSRSGSAKKVARRGRPEPSANS
jgi:hypothetical protein